MCVSLVEIWSLIGRVYSTFRLSRGNIQLRCYVTSIKMADVLIRDRVELSAHVLNKGSLIEWRFEGEGKRLKVNEEKNDSKRGKV